MKETIENNSFNLDEITEITFKKVGDHLFEVKVIAYDGNSLLEYFIPKVFIDNHSSLSIDETLVSNTSSNISREMELSFVANGGIEADGEICDLGDCMMKITKLPGFTLGTARLGIDTVLG